MQLKRASLPHGFSGGTSPSLPHASKAVASLSPGLLRARPQPRLRFLTRSRWLLCASMLLVAASVRADETTGNWSGTLELRGNYYWETSTRVVAPEASLRVVTPTGVDIRAGYLVDAITSASLAAGVVSDVRFTEIRNQGSLGAGYEFDLGDTQLRVDGNARLSHEPDYLSTSGGLSFALSMNQRATVLGASIGFVHDDVGRVLRGQNTTGPDGRNLSNRGTVGNLDGVNLSLSLSQALSRTTTLSGGYELVRTWGFLQNAYRGVMVDGLLRQEQHPDHRARYAVFGRFAHFIEATGTAAHVLMRIYADDWSVAALNPEVRLYQRIGEALTLRLRYRYYVQSAAFFYNTPDQYDQDNVLVTADPKMSSFESHLVGAHALVQLSFLRGGALDFFSRSSFDFSFEYLIQTNRFGNAVLAQSGLVVPF